MGWDIQINFLDGLEKLVSPNLKSVEVCFFHIEKCMGSSLRTSLYNYFKNDEFLNRVEKKIKQDPNEP